MKFANLTDERGAQLCVRNHMNPSALKHLLQTRGIRDVQLDSGARLGLSPTGRGWMVRSPNGCDLRELEPEIFSVNQLKGV